VHVSNLHRAIIRRSRATWCKWRDLTKTRPSLRYGRGTGIAYDREESVIGIGCAAAVVTGADDRPIAALSVSVHLDSVNLQMLGPAVLTSAHTLSREAGRRRITTTW
jgi:DNA-binding IclR family transcriptional regulator